MTSTYSALEGLRSHFNTTPVSDTPADPLKSRPYIVTNESNCAAARAILTAHRDLRGIHIGTSCWENYNLMVASHANYGILFDKSPLVQELNDRTARIIAISNNRFEFMENFQKSFEEDPSLPLTVERDHDLVRNNSKERLHQELENPTSWLGSDENYEAIRAMYSEKKIVHILMDISRDEGIRKIKDWLDEHGYICRTLYLSNIRDWILNDCVKESAQIVAKSEGFSLDDLTDPESLECFLRDVAEHYQIAPCFQKEFLKNIAPLIHKDTLVIDSGYGSPRSDSHRLCPQYVFEGPEYLKGNFETGFLKA